MGPNDYCINALKCSNKEVHKEAKSKKIKPFLRWVGGKYKLANKLKRLLPLMNENSVYWEPFLGAGSLFFALRPEKAVLADLNHDLINCFYAVKEAPDEVAFNLRKHQEANSERYYYEIRNNYNECSIVGIFEKAAAFIFLNKAGFNGIWRVNIKGHYNVPYGHKKNLNLPTLSDLKEASRALSNAKLVAEDYECVLKGAKAGDFVYLDPPYPPLNGTSYFRHYTKERFNVEDQEKLAEIFRGLDSKGCLLMLSNASLPYIRRLYRAFWVSDLNVARYVSANGRRYRVQEIVVTNYHPGDVCLL